MKRILEWVHRTPLYGRIIVALGIGAIVGAIMGPRAADLKPISDVILGFLRLLATPLISLAVLNSLTKTKVAGRQAGRLMFLLMSNTAIAIVIGWAVANILQPGAHFKFGTETAKIDKKPYDFVADLLERTPKDWVTPVMKNEILGIIVLAVATGIALRKVRESQIERGLDGYKTLESLLDTGYEVVMTMMKWVFDLVPIAVFAVVARTVGTVGFEPFKALLVFSISVIVALGLMAGVYLIRLWRGSWVSPKRFLTGAVDAFAMAFSTASSAATLPVTFECATKKIGVKEANASLGIMVGGTFNHDGTALYEAMAALFVSQAIGQNLSPGQQIVVMLMAVIASVGAAGIPEAGLVTMLAVFNAVHLPTEYIALLLPLDWLLDRCRTTINVMGDLASTCILDGRETPVGLAGTD